MKTVTVNGRQLDVLKLIGQGEHSYSFLVADHKLPQRKYVLK
ncbi:MAG: hypothetical protein UHD09_06145 [Bifidobacterium sp.]|nr:hypothetical protein [Bifidobacterium sp.]